MVWKYWPFNRQQDNSQKPQPEKWWHFNRKQKQNQPAETQSPPPQIETKSYFRSYSSSRSCKPDPEDADYMICKEKIKDGNNTYEKEQRVPINQSGSGTAIPVVGMRDFENIFTQFDKELSIAPFFGPILAPIFKDLQEFSPLNPEAYYHQHQGGQNGYPQQARPEQFRQKQKQQQQVNSRYYFNGSGERDFSIRDL